MMTVGVFVRQSPEDISLAAESSLYIIIRRNMAILRGNFAVRPIVI